MEDCSIVSGLTTWRELRGRGAIGAVVKIVVLFDYMGGGGGEGGQWGIRSVVEYCDIVSSG